MDVFILLGAPGSGKGSAAGDLTASGELTHLSTGDMLRAHRKQNTETGRRAGPYMDRGHLVPDEMVVGMVVERLDRDGAEGRFLFDGFPRTLQQAVTLDEILTERGTGVKRVFLLDAPESVLLDRIVGRRSCRSCGSVFHVSGLPEGQATCSQCGGELYQRSDDTPETVAERIEVYNEQTAALIDYYEDRQLLYRVNAGESREKAEAEIREGLKSFSDVS